MPIQPPNVPVGPTSGSQFPALPPVSGKEAFSLTLLSQLSDLATVTSMQLLASQAHALLEAALAAKTIHS